jgi:hypothetical protein
MASPSDSQTSAINVQALGRGMPTVPTPEGVCVKRSGPSARRLVAIIGAGFIGVTVSLFVASPALAHTATVKATTSCDNTGGWTVTWTIENDFGTPATLDSLTPDPQGSAITGFAVSAVIPAASGGANGKITGTQTFPAGETSATLIGHVTWTQDNYPQGLNKTVDKPTTCLAKPQVSFVDNCDGTVTVTLDNQQGNAPATFKITGSSDKTVNGGQKLDVTVPGNVQIIVQTAGQDDWTHKWQTPTSPCPSPTSPSLPTTGSDVSGIAVIGGLTLVGGIGLVALAIVMRRRRNLAG